MRRKLVWIGGSILLLAGSVVALSVLQKQDGAPFPFLEGRVPIRSDDYEGEVRELYYSFRADYADIWPQIDEELRDREYVLRHDSRIAYVRGDRGEEDNVVILRPDIRYEKRSGQDSLLVHDDRGWLSVAVRETRRPTLFDRLRSSLGF